jgi:hypothetical protein
MKLTETQLATIETYLINEGLEYKEFIDEMTDHFIDSIEVKIENGVSFFYALEETGNAFRNEIYYPSTLKIFPKKGLKALEKRFYESKKREIDAELKSHFKTSFFFNSECVGFVLCGVGLLLISRRIDTTKLYSFNTFLDVSGLTLFRLFKTATKSANR